MDVTRSHSLSVGLVGLPNSGKSTLFNALTKNFVPAENYPFCTLDKNIGVVEIQDDRLKRLANFYNSEKIVYGGIKFVDIAGLVQGASKGEGLGNKFLSHIREVDVILYVLRAFKNENISHIYNRINPFEDFEIVQSELIFKDLEVVERFCDESKERDKFKNIIQNLNKGIPIIEMDLTQEELNLIAPLSLLTQKKRMFVLNKREGEEIERIVNFDKEDFVLEMDVKLIGELDEMKEEERKKYLGMIDPRLTWVRDLIDMSCKRLGLITFYTGNSKECNAWSIVKGSNVKEAAGVIHSDFRDNFITADVINVEQLMEVGGWIKAKEQGLVKNCNKEYIVQDGDYIVVLANA